MNASVKHRPSKAAVPCHCAPHVTTTATVGPNIQHLPRQDGSTCVSTPGMGGRDPLPWPLPRGGRGRRGRELGFGCGEGPRHIRRRPGCPSDNGVDRGRRGESGSDEPADCRTVRPELHKTASGSSFTCEHQPSLMSGGGVSGGINHLGKRVVARAGWFASSLSVGSERAGQRRSGREVRWKSFRRPG